MNRSKISKRLLLLDFDRTLFDTARFVEWLWNELERRYGVNADYEKQRAKQFYEFSGDWYDYKFFDHLQTISNITLSQEEFVYEAKVWGVPDLLFDDAYGALSACDEIVTFGNRPYQELKLSLCPAVAAIPVRIIQESKASFIVREYQEPVTLVDDKHLEDELPSSVDFVLIDRSQPVPVVRHRPGFTSINSLNELEHL